MKRTKRLYWIFTGLFLAFILLSAVSQLRSEPETEELIATLEMPLYLLPLLAIAKLLAIVAIGVPGFPKLKEWAYAGIMFNLIGATWCMIAVGGTIDKWGFMILPFLLWGLSYYFYAKRAKTEAATSFA